MRNIYVSDLTLRVLSEERASNVLFREKTAIAACIDGFGANAVELAGIRNVKEDAIVYKTISSTVKSSAVCIPVGFSVEDVEAAWQCVKDAVSPCLQVAVPVSTVVMEYEYHVKDTKMLSKIEELCRAARERCQSVEFVALDATRADRAFLESAIKAAVDAGATAVTICDNAGTMLPEEFAELVTFVKGFCQVPVYVQLSNVIYMAVSSSIRALMAGADGVKCSMVGTNVLNTAKFAAAVFARGETVGVQTSLKATEIQSDITTLLKNIDRPLPDDEPAPEEGQADVFLDKDSTLPQVCEAARLLGYDLSDEDNGLVYKALMAVCARKSSVGAKELEAIIASSAMQAPSTYHLESFVCQSSNITSSMAQVILTRGEEKLSGVAMGDGPIDAAFRAVEQCVGYHYELDKFQIQAVTGGKEALGSALVCLRNNGRLYSGNGLSTDIVGASIRAYLNALNKIVFEEVQK